MIEISNVSMVFESPKQIFKTKNAALMQPLNISGVPFGSYPAAEPSRWGVGRDKALDNVSLTIPDGCIYGFLGSNGAGKSTLMRMICGVYKTENGSIKVDGQEVYDNSAAKEKIFFVNDETIEYMNFTLSSLMSYYKNYYYQTFDKDTFFRLAGVLNLPLDRPMSMFSKGMKRQAVVIIGLACCTKYLMLDEAFDGLDPAMRILVKNIILDEIRKRNASLIVSSHNIAEIGELCDRVMFIHNGKTVFADELDKVKMRFAKYQLVSRDHIITQEEIAALGINVQQYKAVGSVIHIITKDGDLAEEKLRSLNAELVERIPLTLEEVFIHELSITNGII